MPRKARWPTVGIPQLLMLSAYNDLRVFVGEDDYRAFLAMLLESAEETQCEVHAYALTPDRVLLLCTPLAPYATSLLVQATGRRYVPQYNSAYRHSGTIWSGRYRAALVEPTNHVLSAYRFVDTCTQSFGGTAAWTSCSSHTGDRPGLVITDHPRYLELGPARADRAARYRKLCDEPADARSDEELVHALMHNLVFGSEAFKDALESRYQIRARLGKPGRPRNRGRSRRDRPMPQPTAQPLGAGL